MFNSKILFFACGLIAAHASVGYSDVPGPADQTFTARPEVVARDVGLTAVIRGYAANPSVSIGAQEISALNEYANNSTGKLYNSMAQGDRVILSQILNSHPDLFSPSVISKFNTDQKLLARMTTQDNATLAAIVVDIRDGKELSPRQVSDMKDFSSPMISNHPEAFIVELPYLVQYARLNPHQFSLADVELLAQASRDASGISPDQNRLLTEIAGRDTQSLNREDIAAIQDLALKASLGSLNGLDPQVVIALNGIIAANVDNFPANAVENFRQNYYKNQAVKFYLNQQQAPVGKPNAAARRANASQQQQRQQQRSQLPVSPNPRPVAPPTSAGAR